MNKGFEIINGAGQVMISAPHCVAHIREGREKTAEAETKEILLKLCSKTGCYGIYKTYDSKNISLNIDPNYYDSDYKRYLVEFIKKNKIRYLLDLHQMLPQKNGVTRKDICLGTGGDNHCNIKGDLHLLELVQNTFIDNNFTVAINDYNLGATMSRTICQTVARECGIKCLQIEINSKKVKKRLGFLFFNKDYNKLIIALKKIVNLLKRDKKQK